MTHLLPCKILKWSSKKEPDEIFIKEPDEIFSKDVHLYFCISLKIKILKQSSLSLNLP